MNATIYTMESGKKVAYQTGMRRAIQDLSKRGEPSMGWSCETFKDGKWEPAANRWQGLVGKVKSIIQAP